VLQPQAARAFYEDILGLHFIEDSEYALVFKLKDAELRISKVPAFTPFAFTVLDWQVDDFRAVYDNLKTKGVRFEIFEGMGQDEDGVWTVPGDGTQIAWFKDPDGNVLSISKRAG